MKDARRRGGAPGPGELSSRVGAAADVHACEHDGTSARRISVPLHPYIVPYFSYIYAGFPGLSCLFLRCAVVLARM